MKKNKDHYFREPVLDEIFLPFREFIKKEEAGGFLLFMSTLIAMIWANSPLHDSYHTILHTQLSIAVGSFHVSTTLIHFVNDGLMTLFFFVIGLEIKREMLSGALSTFKQAILPVVAAIGGMLCPAAIFAIFNTGTPGAPGWGIPTATDIAFSLGVLALIGNRIPISLKVFLTAVAVADDIGAIIVISLFYAGKIAWLPVGAAAMLSCCLLLINRMGVKKPTVYAILGLGVWASLVQSGIHATVSGVIVAMFVPVRNTYSFDYFIDNSRDSLKVFEQSLNTPEDILNHRQKNSALREIENTRKKVESPLLHMEHTLHPWVTFLIIPMFALANAGVSIPDNFFSSLLHPVTAGIFFGLILGKQVGIISGVWLMVQFKVSPLPKGLTFRRLYGLSWLCGIGFTMSLLITDIAFESQELIDQSKIAILMASLAAGMIGWLLLRFSPDSSSNRAGTSDKVCCDKGGA